MKIRGGRRKDEEEKKKKNNHIKKARRGSQSQPWQVSNLQPPVLLLLRRMNTCFRIPYVCEEIATSYTDTAQRSQTLGPRPCTHLSLYPARTRGLGGLCQKRLQSDSQCVWQHLRRRSHAIAMTKQHEVGERRRAGFGLRAQAQHER